MTIVFVTKSGHAPTKKFAARLLRDYAEASPGDDIKTLAGVAYLGPKVLEAGIRKGKVDKVFVINSLPFPPTAFELASISGPALLRYGSALRQAGKGESSWDVANRINWERS